MRHMHTRATLTLTALLLSLLTPARGADPKESDYYRIIRFATPEGEVIEASGLEIMPGSGKLAVSTRYGDIWLVGGVFDEALEDTADNLEWSLYARGLHEVLGLARYDDWLYACQRGEVTRLKDIDGDERADIFETVADGWEISGDYHEYAFGSKFDADGNMWVTLCLTGSFGSNVLFRGWAVTVSHDGTMTPVSSGIRSPGGVGLDINGDVFYTDNQGPWNGTCILRQLKPGYFMGHPSTYRWYPQAPNMGPTPTVPRSGSRFHVEKERVPELMPPAVFFPYNKMGKSASGLEADRSEGKFGPFAGQLFVSDQTHSTVMRVVLEKIKGYYQGVCFPFRSGFGSGNIAMLQADDGSMVVGGSDRGWGARGGKRYAVDRLVWTGKVPFEIKTMAARKDGFELEFTLPADAKTASSAESYDLSAYTYIMQSNYGSPEVDHSKPKITKITVTDDGMRARLVIDGLKIGHIHELRARGVRSKAGLPLLHDVGYYTLFNLPD